MGTVLDGNPELGDILRLPSPLKGSNFLGLRGVRRSGIADDFLEVLPTSRPRVFHREYPKGEGNEVSLRLELRPMKD